MNETPESTTSTQLLIDLIEKVGFAGMLALAADACDVEIDSCADACEDVSRTERLEALRDHLNDVVRSELRVAGRS